MLLVCKIDKMKKKLQLRYKIEAEEMKLVKNSDDQNELTFRIISRDQSNEYMAE